MSEYIITKEQIKELNRAHGGMQIVTSWLSCYAIWDTSSIPLVMKSEHVAVDLPEIVHCRDCRWCVGYWKSAYCEKFAHALPDDNLNGFCAWGERKEMGE